MKKFIASILIPALLLQLFGCYSFQSISVDNESELAGLENKDIRFTLLTGETVLSEEYHHALITHPSEFIIGKGNRYFKNSNSFESFSGRVLLADVDSVSFNKQQSIFTVWLKMKDRIRFLEGDYFVVTNKTENGFWFWDKNISRKVDPGTISAIEADKINIVNTSLLVGGSVLIIAIIILASTFHFNGSLVGNGSF